MSLCLFARFLHRSSKSAAYLATYVSGYCLLSNVLAFRADHRVEATAVKMMFQLVPKRRIIDSIPIKTSILVEEDAEAEHPACSKGERPPDNVGWCV